MGSRSSRYSSRIVSPVSPLFPPSRWFYLAVGPLNRFMACVDPLGDPDGDCLGGENQASRSGTFGAAKPAQHVVGGIDRLCSPMPILSRGNWSVPRWAAMSRRPF